MPWGGRWRCAGRRTRRGSPGSCRASPTACIECESCGRDGGGGGAGVVGVGSSVAILVGVGGLTVCFFFFFFVPLDDVSPLDERGKYEKYISVSVIPCTVLGRPFVYCRILCGLAFFPFGVHPSPPPPARLPLPISDSGSGGGGGGGGGSSLC